MSPFSLPDKRIFAVIVCVHEEFEGDFEYFSDLAWIGPKLKTVPNEPYNGDDAVTGHRLIVIAIA